MAKMTLDDFASAVNYRQSVEMVQWVEATKLAQAEGEEGFIGRFLTRTYKDWWAEFEAYKTYIALTKRIADGTRSTPERRVAPATLRLVRKD